MSENHWFCPKCGTQNDENFCLKCGEPRPEMPELENEIPKTDTPVDNSVDKPSKKTTSPAYTLIAVALLGVLSVFGFRVYEASAYDLESIKKVAEDFVPADAKNFVGKFFQTDGAVENAAENNQSPPKGSVSGPTKTAGGPEMEPLIEPNNFSEKPFNDSKSFGQHEAIKALVAFHDNITNKRFSRAYSYFSPYLQSKISYEGWIPGFDTTVSSTPTNIRVVSDSGDQVVLTYDLIAVDNPGGTTIFAGTVVMIRTPNGWKIDDVKNTQRY